MRKSNPNKRIPINCKKFRNVNLGNSILYDIKWNFLSNKIIGLKLSSSETWFSKDFMESLEKDNKKGICNYLSYIKTYSIEKDCNTIYIPKTGKILCVYDINNPNLIDDKLLNSTKCPQSVKDFYKKRKNIIKIS